MKEKIKLKTESCIIIDKNDPVLFDNLTDEHRKKYTEKIMERAGNILGQYFSQNPQEAENIFEKENM